MIKFIAGLAAGAILATGGTALASEIARPVPLPQSVNHPCAQEDSVNCYWNANTQGNGAGHSFITREFPGKAHMVCVMYVKARDARRWDYCEALTPAAPHLRFIGRYDGHRQCWEAVGPTTWFYCANGFRESS